VRMRRDDKLKERCAAAAAALGYQYHRRGITLRNHVLQASGLDPACGTDGGKWASHSLSRLRETRARRRAGTLVLPSRAPVS